MLNKKAGEKLSQFFTEKEIEMLSVLILKGESKLWGFRDDREPFANFKGDFPFWVLLKHCPGKIATKFQLTQEGRDYISEILGLKKGLSNSELMLELSKLGYFDEHEI